MSESIKCNSKIENVFQIIDAVVKYLSKKLYSVKQR